MVFDPADPVLSESCAADSPAVLRMDALPVPMPRGTCWWLAARHDSGQRVMYHVHICQTRGDSIHLTQTLAEKGVMP